jgi:transcription initiation factor TFIIB
MKELSQETNHNVSKRQEDQSVCDVCSSTSLLHDKKTGRQVCTECGSIKTTFFDDSAEWSFGVSDSGKKDPSRCGCPSNPLLEKSSLSTSIKGTNQTLMKRLHNQMSMDHVERSLYHVFESITRLCVDNGNLHHHIVEQSKFYYKTISKRKLSRGVIRQGLIACCIMYACKFGNVNRSIKEISKMCNVTVPILNKTNKVFIEYMKDILIKDNVLNQSTRTIDLIPRYCNSLGLVKHIEQQFLKKMLLLEKVIKNDEILDGKTPSSIASGMIMYLCKVNDIDIDKKTFVVNQNISIVTMNKILRIIEADINEKDKQTDMLLGVT